MYDYETTTDSIALDDSQELKQELIDKCKNSEIKVRFEFYMNDLWVVFKCSPYESRTAIRPDVVLEVGLETLIISTYRCFKDQMEKNR